MSKKIIFSAIIIFIFSILLYINIPSSEIKGSLFPEIENSQSFSIELSSFDKNINIIIGGDITIEKSDNLIIPNFLQKIFKKQDGVILNIKNKIFNDSILDIKFTETVLDPSFLEKIKRANISYLSVISQSIYSQGKFFADLTFGNIIDSSIIPLNSANPLIIEKGNKKVKIFSWNISIDNKKNFLAFLNTQSDTFISLVIVDFNSPTALNPSFESEQIAKELIDNGADIVLGVGTKNIQNIEKYRNGIIFYSLGEFYSDNNRENTEGIFTEIIYSEEENKNKIKIFIHPFHFTMNNFLFFSEIDSIEFFSKKYFQNFSKKEMKTLQDSKLLTIEIEE